MAGWLAGRVNLKVGGAAARPAVMAVMGPENKANPDMRIVSPLVPDLFVVEIHQAQILFTCAGLLKRTPFFGSVLRFWAASGPQRN